MNDFIFKEIYTNKVIFPVIIESFRKLNIKPINENEYKVLSVLQNMSEWDVEFDGRIHEYFKNKWLCYGCMNKRDKMLAYVFIKKPLKRPELTIATRLDYINKNISTDLCKFALNDCKNKIIGNAIWSAAELSNQASIKVHSKLDFDFIEVSQDGYAQFKKEI